MERNYLKAKDPQSTPHLVLLFDDGSMEIFQFHSNNTKLKHSWSFKVPKKKGSQKETLKDIEQHLGYSLVISRNKILVFYMGGNKDITILTNDESNNLITIPFVYYRHGVVEKS